MRNERPEGWLWPGLILSALTVLAFATFAYIAYRDYRYERRCEAAGGVPVMSTKCVRRDGFIKVPR
jgi:hypothetical protein